MSEAISDADKLCETSAELMCKGLELHRAQSAMATAVNRVFPVGTPVWVRPVSGDGPPQLATVHSHCCHDGRCELVWLWKDGVGLFSVHFLFVSVATLPPKEPADGK